MTRKRTGYGALQTIALILKVFAVMNVLGAAVCLILMLVALASSASDEGAFALMGAGVMLFYSFAFVMWAILLWGGAELILLLIDVENNTRRTADAVAATRPLQPTPPPERDELPDFSDIEPQQTATFRQPSPMPQPTGDEARAIACPHCKVKINVPAGTPAGRKAKCPKCGNAMIIG